MLLLTLSTVQDLGRDIRILRFEESDPLSQAPMNILWRAPRLTKLALNYFISQNFLFPDSINADKLASALLMSRKL